jgi:hypothetical protein
MVDGNTDETDVTDEDGSETLQGIAHSDRHENRKDLLVIDDPNRLDRLSGRQHPVHFRRKLDLVSDFSSLLFCHVPLFSANAK